jgi:hypothetical protein
MTATRSSAHFFGSPLRNPGEQHGSAIVRRIGLTLRFQHAGFSNSSLAGQQHQEEKS